ncbi:CobW family GTP-binding protein [Natrarchaeobaculum aegyptiacum]|uniref:Cobalamin biosynthesis protein P47K n=1 Tax=Natrarchaeobaculum aegyptiacum TaxID=745377 RepID=A0A2Z2HR90_9EURY|nr:GTP-binding protein [Natrarchaeobaculum aegyptiacum]ARS89660.1 cobalamin biosynthesis protein P47K [Natrarchaeobaculum aegyptiacum]
MSTPVTILCGELGAGKTTLLSSLLESTDRELAVLVNDVGAINVDADLVEARTELETGEEVLALENGCICCGIGGEFSRSVVRLQRERAFDHLVIEASGVSEPEPIARQFVRGPAAGSYDLEAVVTVVDARRFFDRFAASDADAGDGELDLPTPSGPDDDGTRPLEDLVLEQVEFCDLLVVNKCDLVSEAEREHVVALLETLQPRAEIVTTEYGSLDPPNLLGVQRFDLESATEAAGWKRALEGDDEEGGHDHDHDHDDRHDHEGDHSDDRGHDGHDHAHPPDQYGITVDSYHRRRPFHPERLTALLESLPTELVRAKGLCWIAGRERQAITMSHAGDQTTLEVTGRWIASLSEDRQETYRRGQPDLEWDEKWGDRETRLALIGRDLDRDALLERLDDCLLTDDEMDDDWSTFENGAPTSTGEPIVLSSGEPSDGN